MRGAEKMGAGSVMCLGVYAFATRRLVNASKSSFSMEISLATTSRFTYALRKSSQSKGLSLNSSVFLANLNKLPTIA